MSNSHPSESRISPLAFVGPGVELSENITIGPGAVVLGPCVIEAGVYIGAGAQIGAPPEMTDQPQNAAWFNDLTHAGVYIGEGAVIREGAVIHQGSYRATTVGARSWILNRAYVAHDVLIGTDSTVSGGVSIGGHCVIGDRVNIGMNATIHQRVFIGTGCMVGMGTPLARDLPPYVKAYGSPARIHGINVVGMRRNNIDEREIESLQAAYAAGDLLLKKTSDTWGAPLVHDLTPWRKLENRRPAIAAIAPTAA